MRFSLDFYAIKGGRKSPVTLGLAVLSGVCEDDYSCVIGELGVTNNQVGFYSRGVARIGAAFPEHLIKSLSRDSIILDNSKGL